MNQQHTAGSNRQDLRTWSRINVKVVKLCSCRNTNILQGYPSKKSLRGGYAPSRMRPKTKRWRKVPHLVSQRNGTGMTLEKQRGPPPLCQTDPRSGIPSDGSTSIPPAWASVSTENRPPGSLLPEREPPSKRGTCLGTKGEDGAQACPGMRDFEPPWRFMWDTTAILSVLTIIWCPPRTGRKYFKARKTALSSRQFICQKRNSSFHSPLAGLPSKTAPQPVIDASVVIIWRWWIAPILTPLWRKTGSRHINRCRQQLRDTLIRRVAGTVWCNLSSFIQQRNGLMWSSPRGNTGEAAAIRPNSLRQVPTETRWPSLKRAKHAVKTGIRAGAKRACIWTESKRTLEIRFVEMGGAHSSWRSSWGQENGCGRERYPCDDSLAPWSEPEWASRPDSSVHGRPGASKGPVQHPCIW